MAHPPKRVEPVFHDESVDQRLAEWADANWLALERPRLLTAGGSGGRLAAVYLRVLKGRRTPGLRIIKLTGPSGEAGAEPKNHLAALDVRVPGTEEFTERHLVKLDEADFWRLDDSWVMIQLPAGDGIDEPRTLAETGRTASLPERVESIVEGVLGGWNPRPSTGAEEQPPTAAQFVAEILGRRADRDSALRRWARARIGDLADTEPYLAFRHGGRPMPNPLALGAGAPLDAHQVWLTVRGHAHGDLHPGNIMVPEEGEGSPGDYWLIDLSRFSENALLARDPAHLLVCLIADLYLPHLGRDAREELLAALTDREPRCPGPLIPQGLAETVTRLRAAWNRWGAAGHLRINPSWRPQWFLALQGCALMVTARDRYGTADRWWFFRLAAEAGGAYLDEVKAQRPATAPVVGLPEDALAPTLPEGTPVTTLPEGTSVTALPVGTPVTAPASGPPREASVAGAPAVSAAPGTAVVVPDRSGVPPAGTPDAPRASPARAGAAVPQEAAASAAEVRQALDRIWLSFEHTRRVLPTARSAQLRAQATTIHGHVTEYVLALAALRTHPEVAYAAELDRIVELLREVGARTSQFTRALPQRRGPWDDLLSQPPAALDGLVTALDDLLLAVGRARAALPAGSPGPA
ncbi:hypothetical protein [Streptomyces griseosporeus]|uniref:hypothetical protein n=1 Tax=Streptomyces griseosporeus TaxID=1910 RepID=UPI0036FFFDEB